MLQCLTLLPTKCNELVDSFLHDTLRHLPLLVGELLLGFIAREHLGMSYFFDISCIW